MNPISVIWNSVRPTRPLSDLVEMQRVLPIRIAQSLLNGPMGGRNSDFKIRLEHLLARFESDSLSRSWENPEIYPALIGMLNSSDEVDWRYHLSVLELQTGNFRDFSSLPDGVYRIGFPEFGVVSVRSDNVEELSGQLFFRVNDKPTYHVYPRAGLFTKLVGADLYPEEESGGAAGIQIEDFVRCAWGILDSYDSSLTGDLASSISRIVLTPDFGDDIRWSYSLRLRYLSGIFINPYRVNRHGFVESMIHEYCHQRLWLWWSFDPLDGITDNGRQVISPVTGRRRSLAVMFHALLIYIAVEDFYRHCLAEEEMPVVERDWCVERHKHLGKALPELYSRLTGCIDQESIGGRVLQRIWLGSQVEIQN